MEVSVSNKENKGLDEFLVNEANFDLQRIRNGAILLFDKPEHWSSFKLVKKVKYFTKAARVGHAGTLDPLATGLLIIATGKCTKMIESIQALEKEYTGVFNFGKTTPSIDLETEFNGEYPYEHITNADIDEAVLKNTGDVVQTPPVYSAIKVDGTRAYKKARAGEEIVIKSRVIQIRHFEVDKNLPKMRFKVNCSKGTYIRTLTHDFAHQLKSGAYLNELRRTAIGQFRIENALQIDKFQELCGK
ncbi:MAG: tRNA pseudouridine(55) synthase TruB [Bacteroidia bacterium]